MSQSPLPASSQDPPSRSRSRGRLSTTLAALSAKIANTLNSPSEHGGAPPASPNSAPGAGIGLTRWGVQRGSSKGREEDENTIAGSEGGDRSVSRGRDVFQSSGRGGIGNIRRASASRDARPDSGPDDFSPTRGREPRPVLPSDTNQVFSTGRGGAGNIRSPSRDVRTNTAADAVEEHVLKSHLAAEQNAVHSTGRGGIGNITGGSRSRSRARDTSHPPGSGTHTPLHSSGRGGAGNIFSSHAPSVAEADEKDAASHLSPRHSSDIHSTGRGGAANIVHTHAPPVEHTHHTHHPDSYESTGRGGAGNIVHT